LWGDLWENEHCFKKLIMDDRIEGDANLQHSYWEVCGKKMTLGGKASYYVPMLKKFYENYGQRAHLAANNEGVDWKAVSHALRVGYQTRAIFEEGTFEYPLKETVFLKEVKVGRWNYTAVAMVLDTLMEELETLSEKSSLPEKPDHGFWDKWLEDVTRHHVLWGENSKQGKNRFHQGE
jgi:hypothetical protein